MGRCNWSSPVGLSRARMLVGSTLLASSLAQADSVVLVRPDGGRVEIPVRASSLGADIRQGNAEAVPVAGAGAIGDGWCPATAVDPVTATDPSLTLRLSQGVVHRIPLSPGAPLRWDPAARTLAVSARTTSGVPGDGWCPPVQAMPRFAEPLSATPAILDAGAETVLRWRAVDVATCSSATSTYPDGVASVPGWLPTMPVSSTGLRLRLTVAGAYRFRLVCQQGSATVASAVTVEVRAGGAGTTCTGTHAPPPGRVRQTHFLLDDQDLWLASNTDWPRFTRIDLAQWHPPPQGQVDAFGVNRGFPGPFGRTPGDTGTMEIETGKYVALAFDTTGQQGRAGQFSWEQPGAYGAPLLIAFSRCPGDFAPVDARCRSDGTAASGIGWTTGVAAPGYCPLDAGVWYLNIVFGTPANPAQNTCPFAQCRWLFSQSCQAGCGAR